MKNSELNQITLNFILIFFLTIVLLGVIIPRNLPPNFAKSSPTPAVIAIQSSLPLAASRALIAPCEAMPASYRGKRSPLDQQDVEVILAGRKIYNAYCALCHGIEGRGDGIGAIVLDIKPADFTNRDFMNRMPVDCHFAIINEGVGKSMPSWKHLGEDAIWQVLHYERGFTVLP